MAPEKKLVPKKYSRRQMATPTRYRQFLSGELTIDDLDEEEIMRGQLKASDGTFKGRPPMLIPREFSVAIAKKQHQLIQSKIAGMVLDALNALQEVASQKHPQMGDGHRVTAAKIILERYLGRVPETVNLKAEISVWERNAAEARGEVEIEYIQVEEE